MSALLRTLNGAILNTVGTLETQYDRANVTPSQPQLMQYAQAPLDPVSASRAALIY